MLLLVHNIKPIKNRKGKIIMTFKSKQTLVSILGGIALTVGYTFYAFSSKAPQSDDLKSWAIAMLTTIGIGIAAIIVVQILFHIASAIAIAVKKRTKDDETIKRIMSSATKEDELDKLIALKASHVSFSIIGIGFVAALFSLAFGVLPVVALHIIFGSSMLGCLIDGIVSIFYYEKGIR